MIDVAVLEEVAEIFASRRDVDSALARFLDLARRIAGCEFGGIYLRDDTRAVFHRWAENRDTPSLHLPRELVEAVFAGVTQRAFNLDDPPLSELPAVQRAYAYNLHGALGLPLRHDDALVGVLALAFPTAATVPEPTLRVLTAVARFPAAAIVHARTQELAARRARLGTALRQFGERAVATSDVAALHQLILATTVELTGSDQASITEVEDGLVRVIAGIGKDAALVGTTAPAAMLLEALSAHNPYVVPDVSAGDPKQLLIKLAKRTGAASFMALAMRHRERVFGHLFAGAAESYRYHPEEVEAMRILASMSAAILEQRHAQAVADRLTRRLADTIEHLPILVEVFDGRGDFVLGNAASQVLRDRLGLARGTALAPCGAVRVTQLDGELLPPELLPPAQALRGIHPSPREVVLLKPDGAPLATTLMAAAPIFAVDGKTVESVVLAFQDVSALHELAQEKERFLRVAAHELRTPLTALHATTQLIEVDPAAFDDPERRQGLLARLRRQSLRLVRLVEQLLDSVRVDGELPLRPSDVDLTAMCRDVVDMILTSDGPRAVVDAAAGAVVGRWDAVRIEQVVTNLVSNAVRYSPADGLIHVVVERDGDRARLSVRDDGIGIPAAQLDQLFTPFFRGSNAQRANAGGLGLGLHIAREIVHRHGGTIEVASRENGGTTFTVLLPLGAAQVS
ncbi:MAG: Sensor protein [Myxococcales bacterium]|nr:Sensor protein [Myxococcales bacterium]